MLYRIYVHESLRHVSLLPTMEDSQSAYRVFLAGHIQQLPMLSVRLRQTLMLSVKPHVKLDEPRRADLG
jgi:hypothetical protein